ncbi:MAG: DUF3341 domain-containing protein [Myxococcota bacterium]|jgi:hypothetical protein|nr:DUF3341 domain-containing protein [Myxococcota bacterium]
MTMFDRLRAGFPRPRKPLPARCRLHTLTFDDPERALEAVRALRENQFEILDVHSPFPIHGIDEALGMEPTRLPWATFIGAASGLTIALGFQIWSHTSSWPLIIGGKSTLALPALIPVAFEATVLLGAFGTLAALLLAPRLHPFRRAAIPSSQPSPAVSDNHFVVVVVQRDASFDPGRFGELREELAPVDAVDGWRVL